MQGALQIQMRCPSLSWLIWGLLGVFSLATVFSFLFMDEILEASLNLSLLYHTHSDIPMVIKINVPPHLLAQSPRSSLLLKSTKKSKPRKHNLIFDNEYSFSRILDEFTTPNFANLLVTLNETKQDSFASVKKAVNDNNNESDSANGTAVDSDNDTVNDIIAAAFNPFEPRLIKHSLHSTLKQNSKTHTSTLLTLVPRSAQSRANADASDHPSATRLQSHEFDFVLPIIFNEIVDYYSSPKPFSDDASNSKSKASNNSMTAENSSKKVPSNESANTTSESAKDSEIEMSDDITEKKSDAEKLRSVPENGEKSAVKTRRQWCVSVYHRPADPFFWDSQKPALSSRSGQPLNDELLEGGSGGRLPVQMWDTFTAKKKTSEMVQKFLSLRFAQSFRLLCKVLMYHLIDNGFLQTDNYAALGSANHNKSRDEVLRDKINDIILTKSGGRQLADHSAADNGMRETVHLSKDGGGNGVLEAEEMADGKEEDSEESSSFIGPHTEEASKTSALKKKLNIADLKRFKATQPTLDLKSSLEKYQLREKQRKYRLYYHGSESRVRVVYSDWFNVAGIQLMADRPMADARVDTVSVGPKLRNLTMTRACFSDAMFMATDSESTLWTWDAERRHMYVAYYSVASESAAHWRLKRLELIRLKNTPLFSHSKSKKNISDLNATNQNDAEKVQNESESNDASADMSAENGNGQSEESEEFAEEYSLKETGDLAIPVCDEMSGFQQLTSISVSNCHMFYATRQPMNLAMRSADANLTLFRSFPLAMFEGSEQPAGDCCAFPTSYALPKQLRSRTRLAAFHTVYATGVSVVGNRDIVALVHWHSASATHTTDVVSYQMPQCLRTCASSSSNPNENPTEKVSSQKKNAKLQSDSESVCEESEIADISSGNYNATNSGKGDGIDANVVSDNETVEMEVESTGGNSMTAKNTSLSERKPLFWKESNVGANGSVPMEEKSRTDVDELDKWKVLKRRVLHSVAPDRYRKLHELYSSPLTTGSSSQSSESGSLSASFIQSPLFPTSTQSEDSLARMYVTSKPFIASSIAHANAVGVFTPYITTTSKVFGLDLTVEIVHMKAATSFLKACISDDGTLMALLDNSDGVLVLQKDSFQRRLVLNTRFNPDKEILWRVITEFKPTPPLAHLRPLDILCVPPPTRSFPQFEFRARGQRGEAPTNHSPLKRKILAHEREEKSDSLEHGVAIGYVVVLFEEGVVSSFVVGDYSDDGKLDAISDFLWNWPDYIEYIFLLGLATYFLCVWRAHISVRRGRVPVRQVFADIPLQREPVGDGAAAGGQLPAAGNGIGAQIPSIAVPPLVEEKQDEEHRGEDAAVVSREPVVGGGVAPVELGLRETGYGAVVAEISDLALPETGEQKNDYIPVDERVTSLLGNASAVAAEFDELSAEHISSHSHNSL